jgi:hypothetical protein
MTVQPETPTTGGLSAEDLDKIQAAMQGRQGYFGRAERLLGATAVLGAATYALLNVLYVEFYDDFGVRPEEVGWDRLTMLSRTAWVVLSVILGTAVFLLSKALLSFFLSWRARNNEDATPEDKKRIKAALASHPIFTWFALALLGILVGYWYLTFVMENEADRVSRGETVNGVGIFVPFIDVRAYRAEAAWLGEAQNKPAQLGSPHLTYLGRGRDVAVFVACGSTTVVVPADQVAINIVNQGHSDIDRERQRREFDALCR